MNAARPEVRCAPKAAEQIALAVGIFIRYDIASRDQI